MIQHDNVLTSNSNNNNNNEDLKSFVQADETAFTLFHRAERRSEGWPLEVGLKHFPCLLAADVVEIYGPTSTGKSEILMAILIKNIFPKNWNGISIGGNEVNVVWFDNDMHFNTLRLLAIIEMRLKRILGPILRSDLDNWDDLAITTLLPDFENFLNTCLSRIHVVHPNNSFEFLVALQSLKTTIERDNIKLIFFDSISSFFWQDKSDDNPSHWISILVQTLKKFYGVAVICTKQCYFIPKYQSTNHDDETAPSIINWNGANLFVNHREYLGSNWHNFVKYRVVVARQKETSSVSQFSACIVFPHADIGSALRFQYEVDKGGAFVL